MIISVVMAIYNGRLYLKEQLESIGEQTVCVDEIIIIDDCSSECSDDIIQDFSLKYKIKIKYIKHDVNKGYASTFIEALSLAEGDYIFFSDQDDIWETSKIQKMVDCMKINHNISCLSSLNIIVNSEGSIRYKESKYGTNTLHKVTLNSLVKQKELRPGMSIAITKKLKYEIFNWNIYEYLSHDRIIEFISANHDGFYILNKHLNYYRIHSTNTSGLNLGFKLRTNRNGRILQIDKEIKYLKTLIDEKRVKNIDIIRIIEDHILYYEKRKKYLLKNGFLYYIVHSITLLSYYSSMKVWLGDIASIINISFIYKKGEGKNERYSLSRRQRNSSVSSHNGNK